MGFCVETPARRGAPAAVIRLPTAVEALTRVCLVSIEGLPTRSESRGPDSNRRAQPPRGHQRRSSPCLGTPLRRAAPAAHHGRLPALLAGRRSAASGDAETPG